MRKDNETLKLWRELKKMGGFSDTYYDNCIIHDLKKALSIDGDFEIALQKINAVNFLNEFFTVLSPLNTMYTDILTFFEKSRATTGKKNIEIAVGSEELEIFNFNVSHFTHAKEVMSNIKQSIKNVLFTQEGVYKLFRINQGYYNNRDLDRTSAPIIWNKSFRKWYDVYSRGEAICPEVDLDYLDTIKTSAIREELTTAFTFWTALFDFYKTNNAPRKEWRDLLPQMHDNANTPILYCETDYVLGSSLASLYYLSENYETFCETEKEKAKKTLREFDRFVFQDTIEKSMPLWEEFLKLPVWERRHDLYSVWVFTQMVADLPETKISYNVTNNALHFSFAKELILTLESRGVKIDFWNELKSAKIKTLLGAGRTNFIQPDFSVLCGSPNDADSSIAVVECKQYKTPSYTNFSHAIIDYVNNRPNAKIFLADYGNFNLATLKSKITVANERYELLPLCRPDHKNKEILSKQIWDIVHQHIGMSFLEGAASFILKWNEKPADLDLHLFYRPSNSNETQRLFYGSREIPDAEYSNDMQNGWGPESIKINKWNEGTYELLCHNFSCSPSLSASNATITASFDEELDSFTLKCPSEGDYQWWHILTVETRTGDIKIVNEIVDVTERQWVLPDNRCRWR